MLGGLHIGGSMVSTEYPHQRRVLGIAIPHLKKILSTIYVKYFKGDVDQSSFWLRYVVNTVSSWVCIRVQWWGQYSTLIVVIATTSEVKCIILNLKTISISKVIWLKPLYSQKLINTSSDFYFHPFTWSSCGFGWLSCMEGCYSDFHRIFPSAESPQDRHP